jgi:hypothetical protein
MASIATIRDSARPVNVKSGSAAGRQARSHRPSATSFVTWDGRDAHGRGLANGVYFLKLSAGDYRQTEKLVLQR